MLPYDGHRSGSTLAHVMACCLTAPSHYLNLCWLIISDILWHSSKGSFHKKCSRYEFENDQFKITATSLKGNELMLWLDLQMGKILSYQVEYLGHWWLIISILIKKQKHVSVQRPYCHSGRQQAIHKCKSVNISVLGQFHHRLDSLCFLGRLAFILFISHYKLPLGPLWLIQVKGCKLVITDRVNTVLKRGQQMFSWVWNQQRRFVRMNRIWI